MLKYKELLIRTEFSNLHCKIVSIIILGFFSMRTHHKLLSLPEDNMTIEILIQKIKQEYC